MADFDAMERFLTQPDTIALMLQSLLGPTKNTYELRVNGRVFDTSETYLRLKIRYFQRFGDFARDRILHFPVVPIIVAAAYFGVSLSSLLVQGVLGFGLPVPLSVST